MIAVAPPDGLGASILIVDDQRANVLLLERMLRDEGYPNVTSTTLPGDVAALHLESDFDLILLDLQMPGMDGFEVMDALKAQVADAYLPVIVLTAQPAHKLRALQAGAKDFISKPFDLLEVKTRIRNMLEVRLLYRRLEGYAEQLEQTVRERTDALVKSEARFRRLVELASDWYWEQDEHGVFTQVSGPAFEMMGFGLTADSEGWNPTERLTLQTKIAEREPFIDLAFSRVTAEGVQQRFRVSGEPMFDESARFIGYRGIGIETSERTPSATGSA